MPSGLDNFFNDNLITICFNNNNILNNLNCLLGAFEIILSLIFIIFIIYGLIKLLNYYEKINFETVLLLVSIIQIILLDIIIIIPHDLLFDFFFFLQICHISLIRKFIKLIKQDSSQYKENLIFTIIILVNVFIFSLYLLSLLDIFLNNIYLYIQSSIRIYYFLTAIFLTFLCRELIKKIKIYEKTNESYEIKLKSKDSLYSNTNNSNKVVLSFQNNEWMYFLMRERQIVPLYVLNLICSFIQMSFILSKQFILNDIFKKNEYRVISLTNKGYIIYYIYIFICFLNALVNYFSFYWIVRHQYNSNNDISKLNRNKKRKIIDNNFIQRETIKNEEDEKEIKALMEEKIKDKKNFMKSIYSNTFTEVTEDNDKDKEENYFIQEKDKDIDNKKIELIDPSFEGIPGVGTMVSNNPINQSTVNNESLL